MSTNATTNDIINDLAGNRRRRPGRGLAPSVPLLGAIPPPGASLTGFDSDSFPESPKRQDQEAKTIGSLGIHSSCLRRALSKGRGD